MKATFAVQKNHAALVAALIFAIAFSFLFYFYFLQTASISISRLALTALLFLLSAAGIYYFSARVFANIAHPFRLLAFWLTIPLLLTPHFLPQIKYPVSPLFQRTSNLIVTVEVPASANGVAAQLNDHWLNIGSDDDSRNFTYAGDWEKDASGMSLHAGGRGQIIWHGRVGELASFVLEPIGAQAIVSVNWDGEEQTQTPGKTTIVFKKRFFVSAWLIVALAIARASVAGIILFFFSAFFRERFIPKYFLNPAIIFVIVSLALFTVWAQFENPEIKGRTELQIERHNAVMHGEADAPWQYRVFAEGVVDGVAKFIGYFNAFVLVRVVQNLLIFMLAWMYFREWNFSIPLTIFGLTLLTGALLNAFHQSDLSFNIYFDIIFYLLALLLISERDYVWLPALTLIAALNRETSGLIPLLALASLSTVEAGSPKRRALTLTVISFLLWVAVTLALRLLYPNLEIMTPYNVQPGMDLLRFNLAPSSLYLLFLGLGLVPLAGLLAYPHWPRLLKYYFVAVIPLWLLIHLFLSVVGETRLFLVPMTIVLIPCALVAVRAMWDYVLRSTQYTAI